MPDEIMPEPTPSMRATLHITPSQVRVHDLSRPGVDHKTVGSDVTSDISPHLTDDLVTLDLGTPDVGVSLLGTLEHLVDVVSMAVAELGRVGMDRKADGR